MTTPLMLPIARITAIATIKNATTVTLEWDNPTLAITDFDLFALGTPLDWKENTVLLAGPGERLELTHRAHSRDVFARGNKPIRKPRGADGHGHREHARLCPRQGA